MICTPGLQLIKHYESLHDGDKTRIGLQPKMDPIGIWTAGYGHALSDPETGQFLKGEANRAKALALTGDMTEAQAEALLTADLARFESIVSTHCTRISPPQFAACVSLCYNIGAGNFASSSVVRFIKAMKYAEAADAFLLWNKASVNGKRVELPGLTARRKSERHLLLTGEFKKFN